MRLHAMKSGRAAERPLTGGAHVAERCNSDTKLRRGTSAIRGFASPDHSSSVASELGHHRGDHGCQDGPVKHSPSV